MAGLRDTVIMAGYNNSRKFMNKETYTVLYDTITYPRSNLADDLIIKTDTMWYNEDVFPRRRRRILGVSYERQVWGQ